MARTKPSVAWNDRELPSVDERRCSASGLCVAICPTDCLAMSGRLPWLARPGHCLSCGLCAEICPTDAITLMKPVGE